MLVIELQLRLSRFWDPIINVRSKIVSNIYEDIAYFDGEILHSESLYLNNCNERKV